MVRIVIGVAIAVLGGIGLWIEAIPYTERETLELGPIQASADVEREWEIPPLAGGAMIALGAGIAAYGAARRRS